jgi:hypothetical protein
VVEVGTGSSGTAVVDGRESPGTVVPPDPARPVVEGDPRRSGISIAVQADAAMSSTRRAGVPVLRRITVNLIP